ncbi:hypothetical protein GEMRC1_007157 [Eukaryota sp. GEM-RC1]
MPPKRRKGATAVSGDADPDIVLAHVEELTKRDRAAKKKRLTVHDIESDIKLKEVKILNASEVSSLIEEHMLRVTHSILSGDGISFTLASRASSNQHFVEELERIVLGDKETIRSFANVSMVKKTAIMCRVLRLVRELCDKGIHTTKRDLFYTDVKLFGDQLASDDMLDDCACLLGVTRTSLHVVASEKGVVVGRLQYTENGDPIDCSRMGVGGKAIPPFIDQVVNLQSDAKFILLVEKDAAFMRLSEDRFYNRYPCIIITAKGQPDVATRLFLSKLKEVLGIPILGLFDSDPYGLKILSVYMSGSKNMSYDSAHLTTPDIKWLGVLPSDLDKYRIPAQCRLPMTDKDIKTGKELLEEDFIKRNPDWVRELNIMIKKKEKAEIQALSTFGFQYLTQEYLPRKIRDADWI